MTSSFKPRTLMWALLPFILGAIVFVFATGGAVLWPQNVSWLMDGDPATHWLGWQFFRHSPLIQWPLGANPAYGTQIGSSIVFTDSIPLMAFLLKPLNAILPDTFQYIGLWILICFALQSYFSWKLLSLFTQNKWLVMTGSLFFTIAPVYLMRLGMHYALFGHWVIVAALYFYCSSRFFMRRWTLLLIATTLIHAYLLAMVLAVWLTDIIQRRWLKQLSTAKSLLHVVVGFIIVALVMWAAGYFMLKGGVQTGGFGFYRMNLLSLIDSNNVWSNLLPDQPNLTGDYEGFGYLGSGVLGLALIAAFTYVRQPRITYEAKAIPLVILCVLLFIYALSDHIAVGASESFQYSLPEITQRLTNTFRVSGRFVWPVYYALYLGILYLVFTRLKHHIAIGVCSLLLVFQIVDMNSGWQHVRKVLNSAPAWVSPMQSPAWTDLAKRYKHIVYVLPSNQPPNWLPLSEFAAMHQLSINVGYFARTNMDVEDQVRKDLAASVMKGEFDADSLYVFDNDFLWTTAQDHQDVANVQGVLDGFRILAPGLRDCAECKPDTTILIEAGDRRKYDYTAGPIQFTLSGTGRQYQIAGWSATEAWGTWSNGKSALIRLNLTATPKNDLKLIIDANAYVVDQHPTQVVDVVVNGQTVGSLSYDMKIRGGKKIVTIPKEIALNAQGQLSILFKFKDAVVPATLGISGETRNLALALLSLEIQSD